MNPYVVAILLGGLAAIAKNLSGSQEDADELRSELEDIRDQLAGELASTEVGRQEVIEQLERRQDELEEKLEAASYRRSVERGRDEAAAKRAEDSEAEEADDSGGGDPNGDEPQGEPDAGEEESEEDPQEED